MYLTYQAAAPAAQAGYLHVGGRAVGHAGVDKAGQTACHLTLYGYHRVGDVAVVHGAVVPCHQRAAVVVDREDVGVVEFYVLYHAGGVAHAEEGGEGFLIVDGEVADGEVAAVNHACEAFLEARADGGEVGARHVDVVHHFEVLALEGLGLGCQVGIHVGVVVFAVLGHLAEECEVVAGFELIGVSLCAAALEAGNFEHGEADGDVALQLAVGLGTEEVACRGAAA